MLKLSQAINNNYIFKSPKQLSNDRGPRSSTRAFSRTHLRPSFTGSSSEACAAVHLTLFLFSSQTVTGLGSDAMICYLTAIFLNISSLHLKLSSSSVFI